VLFSEPKIPQLLCTRRDLHERAEFQCSSASRKFLNAGARRKRPRWVMRFSALQRAENSSIEQYYVVHLITLLRFSALQRAENSSIKIDDVELTRPSGGFSALQRAENSSIH